MNVLSSRFVALFLSALCTLFSVAAFGQTYILQQNFEGSFPPAGWTFYTNPNAALGWVQGPVSPLIDPCIPQGSKTMTSQWATYYANDTWAFTPGQNLTAGITYDISFAQCVKSPSNNKTESMKLTVGTSASYQAQTTTLLNLPTLNNTSPVTRTASFTPQVSGTYYFAFHCYSAANQRYLSVDDVKISFTVSCTTTTTPVSASICPGSTYNFHGNILSSPGNYSHTLSDINGCDSIIQLTLSVRPISTTPVSASICAGNTYNFYGNTLTSPGNYNHTLSDVYGCDSIIQLTLSVHQISTTPVSASICAGNAYSFYGNTLTSAGNYNHTLSDVYGCDSIIQLTLSVHQISTTPVSASICAGNTYNFYGNTLTSPGNYNHTLSDVYGCDSIIQLTLSVNQISTTPISASICTGNTYNFYGNTLTSPGNYNHTLSDVYGCDSIIQLTLSVHQISTTPVSVSICAGNTYNFYGNTLTSAGNYNHTLSDVYGCDSIIQLTLSVHQISTTPVSASICAGNTYNFYGNTLTSAGNYNHTLSDVYGCDSIIQLTLSVHQISTTPVSASICAGNAYNFYGNTLTSAGNYNHTLSDVYGCDSIIQLTLSVHSISTTNITAAICPGNTYNFHGNILTIPGIYQDTLFNVQGCDSIVRLHLFINPTTDTPVSAAICPGDTYNFHGYLLTVPGTYYDTLLNIQGCDSVIVLNLTAYSLLDITVAQSGASLQANEIDAAYQWIECSNQNNIIPGATAQSYTAIYNGDYAVVLDKNGCIDTSACYTVNTLSAVEETFQDLILYPNPAREVIYITSVSNIEQVRMMDITGKQVLLKENIKMPHIQVDLGSFPEGMYFLEIIYEKGKTIKQVIKS